MAVVENKFRNPGINEFKDEPTGIDYNDDRIQRLTEIMGNLEDYYNTNKELFKSEDDFKKNFHYNDRSQLQKDILDSFFKSKMKPTEQIDMNEDIFGGMDLSPKTPEVGTGSKVEEPKATEAKTTEPSKQESTTVDNETSKSNKTNVKDWLNRRNK